MCWPCPFYEKKVSWWDSLYGGTRASPKSKAPNSFPPYGQVGVAEMRDLGPRHGRRTGRPGAGGKTPSPAWHPGLGLVGNRATPELNTSIPSQPQNTSTPSQPQNTSIPTTLKISFSQPLSQNIFFPPPIAAQELKNLMLFYEKKSTKIHVRGILRAAGKNFDRFRWI